MVITIVKKTKSSKVTSKGTTYWGVQVREREGKWINFCDTEPVVGQQYDCNVKDTDYGSWATIIGPAPQAPGANATRATQARPRIGEILNTIMPVAKFAATAFEQDTQAQASLVCSAFIACADGRIELEKAAVDSIPEMEDEPDDDDVPF